MFKSQLIRFENRTGIDIEYYLFNGSWLILSQIISIFSGILLAVVLTRSLSLEVFGSYQYLIALFGMFSFLSVPGIKTSLMGSLSKGFDGGFLKGLKLRFIWSLLGIPILAMIGLYYVWFTGQKELAVAIIIASMLFPFWGVSDMWQIIFQSKQMFKILSLYSIAAMLLNVVTIILILVFSQNVIVLFAANIGSRIIVNSLILWRAFPFLSNAIEEEEWRSYGYYLSKINILAVLTGKLDHILVGVFMGMESLALYTIGIKMAIQVQGLVSSLLQTTTPKIARADTVNREKYLILFTGTLAASILLIVISPGIIRLLFTEAYNDSIIFTQIILGALPFFVINNVYAKHFKYYVKNRNIIFLIHIFSPLTRILLQLAIIISFQSIGLAIIFACKPIINLFWLFLLNKIYAEQNSLKQ